MKKNIHLKFIIKITCFTKIWLNKNIYMSYFNIAGCIKSFVKTKEVRIRTKHGESFATPEMEMNRQVEIYISNSRTRMKRAAAKAEAERSRNDSNRDNNSSASLFDDSLSGISQGATNL